MYLKRLSPDNFINLCQGKVLPSSCCFSPQPRFVMSHCINTWQLVWTSVLKQLRPFLCCLLGTLMILFPPWEVEPLTFLHKTTSLSFRQTLSHFCTCHQARVGSVGCCLCTAAVLVWWVQRPCSPMRIFFLMATLQHRDKKTQPMSSLGSCTCTLWAFAILIYNIIYVCVCVVGMQ